MRKLAGKLGPWLHDLVTPVFILDDNRELVFANAATAQWLDLPLENLSGRCDFATSDADNRLAALGPPAEVYLGQRVVLEQPLRGDGAAAQPRFLEFIPLVESEVCVGVLGLLHEVAPPLAPPPSEALRLHQALQQQRRAWRGHFALARLVGESSALRQVRAQLQVAAATRATVLITGPRGSGRRTVARIIHALSDCRGNVPLVPLVSAAMTGEQLISHCKPTGGRGSQREGASLPTILLTDAEDLSVESQATLLSLLSESAQRVRVLATCSTTLDERVAVGAFSAELAQALATIAIRLPRLAERKGDLPLLAQQLVEECNAETGKQLTGFSSAALDAMHAHSWPGELTELAAFVAECHRRADGPYIQPPDMPPRVHHAARATERVKREPTAIDLEAHLARIEKELIEAALTAAKQNKTKAAKQLGLTRPRLYRRMVQLGLAAPASEPIEMEEQE